MWSSINLKTVVTVLSLLSLACYLFLFFRMTFVPIESAQLEPDIKRGDLLSIHHGENVRPGDLVAFETDDGLVIQRVFMIGAARVKCIAGNAVVDGRLVEYRRSSSEDLRLATALTVKERWGSLGILVIKRQQLLPYPLPIKEPDIRLGKDQLLTGCQNRIACNGCGFHRVDQAQVLGRVGLAAAVWDWAWLRQLSD